MIDDVNQRKINYLWMIFKLIGKLKWKIDVCVYQNYYRQRLRIKKKILAKILWKQLCSLSEIFTDFETSIIFLRRKYFFFEKTIFFREKFFIRYSIFFLTLRTTEEKLKKRNPRRDIFTHQDLFSKNISIQIKLFSIIHWNSRK